VDVVWVLCVHDCSTCKIRERREEKLNFCYPHKRVRSNLLVRRLQSSNSQMAPDFQASRISAPSAQLRVNERQSSVLHLSVG